MALKIEDAIGAKELRILGGAGLSGPEAAAAVAVVESFALLPPAARAAALAHIANTLTTETPMVDL